MLLCNACLSITRQLLLTGLEHFWILIHLKVALYMCLECDYIQTKLIFSAIFFFFFLSLCCLCLTIPHWIDSNVDSVSSSCLQSKQDSKPYMWDSVYFNCVNILYVIEKWPLLAAKPFVSYWIIQHACAPMVPKGAWAPALFASHKIALFMFSNKTINPCCASGY